ncbi:MAG TPA: hypothetical protein VIF57_28700 [Polyangia bacterium]|jgi:hypothetical protein
MSEAAKFDSHRRLCPDGACIGVIGSDGRCRICGRNAGGGGEKDEPPAGFVPPDFQDDDDDQDGDAAEDAAASVSAAGGKGAAFDPNRRLCPDGECLGVIGADGVCNVCGKKAD